MPQTTRRAFLQSTTAGLAALAAGAGEAPRRPNFLFIYTDDQRWDTLGVVQNEQGEKARFPWLKTPNLDRLAAQGARFRNAFVVNALCAPSRATFLTGCYGHVNGIVNNHTPFSADNITWSTLLRQAGYVTGYVGKWHMGSQSGKRPGFDFSASFVGQGVYFDCPVEVNGQKTPTKGWIDDVSTEYATQFIRENRDKPFAIALGFKTCHGPFEPPPRFADAYAGEQARPAPNLNVSAIYRPAAPGDDSPAAPRTNLGYFRAISAVDENVGKLLALLDELKIAEDTVVIYASDNGFYLGEHRLGDKRSAYDESLRIPLLLRYPRMNIAGKRIDGMALNVDLAPTLLDLAGVPVPKEMHGRSWRPLLEGKAGGWRDAFFYCYFFERNFATPTTTAVRTDTAKLIKYPGHEEWTELFDLAADPYEMRNLASDPAAAELRKRMEAEYERQSKAIAFQVPPFAGDSKQGQPARPLNAWVLEYRFDRDEGDIVKDASGKNNHGTAKNAPVVEGRDGKKARRFDGRSSIEVPRSPSLNPAVAGWTVEVTFKADAPDGVLLARGGATHGYALYLRQGCPVFTVNAANRAATIGGKEPLKQGWARLAAGITTDRQLVLRVDDAPVATGRLREFIPQDPNDSMQVGADLGSPVLEKPAGGFSGLIESVRIYSGEAPAPGRQ